VSPRSRNALFAAISMIGSVVLVLLLAEVAVRIWVPGGEIQPDPAMIRSMVPNFRREVAFVEPHYRPGQNQSAPPQAEGPLGSTSTNNLGFRMLADVKDKRPDERRILLLGDSYLAAMEVDARDSFFEIVSRRLDEETRGRWKIINLGISSGSPLQYLMQLHHWGERLQPDLVIVFLGANDSPDDVRTGERYGIVTDENGVPIHPAKQFSLALIRASHLARYFAQFTLNRIPDLFVLLSPPRATKENVPQNTSRRNIDSWIELACEASEASKQAFLEGTGRNLRMLKDEASELGAGFAVVIVHYPFYFPDEPFYETRWPQDFLEALKTHGCLQSEGRPFEDFARAFLRENGIEFASTYDRFLEAKRRSPEQKLWHFYDYHYNPVGHRLAAEELHGLVKRLIASRPGEK